MADRTSSAQLQHELDRPEVEPSPGERTPIHHDATVGKPACHPGDTTTAEALLISSSQAVLDILKMIFAGAPLDGVLMSVARLIEALGEGMLCSILLLDKDGIHLRYGASGSLPESYRVATDGLTIGPNVGSCGTAVYRRQPVFVADITSDPLWADFRNLAIPLGLRACWSAPIMSHEGKVLGTFAIYYHAVRSPGPSEVQLIDHASRIAGIAIEHHRAQEDLRRSEAYLTEAQRLTHTGTWVLYPSAPDNVYWTPEHYRIFGFDPAEDAPSRTAALQRVHPEDRVRVDHLLEESFRNKSDFETHFRVFLPDGTVKHLHGVGHPVVNEGGEVVELVGTSMDVTEQQETKIALEKAFEEIKILKDQLYKENLALRDEVDRASMFEEVVGNSSALQAVLSRVSKVAPTDSTVLITGETGTGKELIARAVHRRSKRSERAFVSVNCAALAPSLISSELFGHEKGAFTGATQRRLGRFELADGGTIFLDEVGELPADIQVALLRVLQEREFERVGGAKPVQVDVRVIAASNRDLEVAIASGTFRSDLFYRLNVFPIEMPPLRERKDDILMLLEYFVKRYASKASKNVRRIDKRTLELFQSYNWPGNIRELQNVIERSVILTSGDVFSVDEAWLSKSPLRAQSGPLESQSTNGESRGEREIIMAALMQTRGRVSGPSGAAAKLRIPPSTLESKIKALKIPKSQFKLG